jgi:hypothetical protein
MQTKSMIQILAVEFAAPPPTGFLPCFLNPGQLWNSTDLISCQQVLSIGHCDKNKHKQSCTWKLSRTLLCKGGTVSSHWLCVLSQVCVLTWLYVLSQVCLLSWLCVLPWLCLLLWPSWTIKQPLVTSLMNPAGKKTTLAPEHARTNGGLHHTPPFYLIHTTVGHLF